MQWARRITAEHGRLVTEVADDAGDTKVELVDLIRHGLPTVQSYKKRVIDTPFSEWRPVSPEEYREGFGLKDSSDSFHTVYQTRTDRLRLLTPALALLRAFFGPTTPMLTNAFGPCALEQISVVDWSVEPPAVYINGHRTQQTRYRRNPDSAERLTWMRSHPSAREMVGSVHEYAMRGCINLKLPLAKVSLVAHGKRVEDAILVTRVNIVTLIPLDEPTLVCQLTSNNYSFRAVQSRAHRDRLDTKAFCRVPLLPNGGIKLTDLEWQKIEPLALTPRGRGRSHLDQRAIIDGVLTKLVTQAPWSSIEYAAGGVTHATAAFRRLAGSGRLAQILAILTETRNTKAER